MRLMAALVGAALAFLVGSGTRWSDYIELRQGGDDDLALAVLQEDSNLRDVLSAKHIAFETKMDVMRDRSVREVLYGERERAISLASLRLKLARSEYDAGVFSAENLVSEIMFNAWIFGEFGFRKYRNIALQESEEIKKYIKHCKYTLCEMTFKKDN